MPASPPPKTVIEVADGFWNIRGSFKIGGVIDVGTQASLVRRASGKYVLLDTCAFSEPVARWIDELTSGGDDIEAIINLHPFHTLHVRAAHERYPKAKLFGTARHLEKQDDLPWESARTEGSEFHQAFADDFDFSVPRGVDFISRNEKLHFASVLAFHGASKTLHVDDSIVYVRLPWLLRPFGRELTRLHPTLAKVLEPRAGAVDDFRQWTRELIERARSVENLCAAHAAVLLGRRNKGASIAERIEAAVTRVNGKLEAHARKHG